MLRGDFERAWEQSDLAGASCTRERLFESQTILIRCLRGLGDAIQFLRYAKELSGGGRTVFVQGPEDLIPILEFIPGIAGGFALEGNSPMPAHDCTVECSDLPYLFRTTSQTIPFPEGYIAIPEGHLRGAEALLNQHGSPGLRVGVVWAAGAWKPERSLAAHLLQPLANIRGVKMFSLQRGPEAAQMGMFSPGTCLSTRHREETIATTAALISRLDLVVSVDTMVAHLAGALGRPVWTLLLYEANWRWMLDRSDSPWYRSMRLFRQPHPGNWEAVIRRVERELRQLTRRAFRDPVPLRSAPGPSSD
jgi:hypothetical protein